MKLKFNDKKLQSNAIRFLMVDNQQITFNSITQTLEQQQYNVQGKLLDDLNSFDKLLNLQWDMIVFHHAYDFNYTQALKQIKQKGKSTPVVLLSDIDPKSSEAITAYKAGIYDIASANHLEYLTLSICRAALYNRLQRKEKQLTQEIDKLQQQTQTLVETNEHAVAIFQEGVHISVNAQYAKLFGTTDIEEFIGLPLLDILQPEDIVGFKQHFKRLSKGDFSQAAFTIQSLNPQSQEKQLALQFSSAEFEDEPALQLVIITEVATATKGVTKTSSFANEHEILQHIQSALSRKEAAGLVLFVIDDVSSTILSQNWNTSTSYFNQIQSSLNASIPTTVLRISEHVFLTVIALEHAAAIQHSLKGYLAKLPTQLTLDQQKHAVHLHIAYTVLNQIPVAEQLSDLLHTAFTQRFDANTIIQNDSGLSITPSLNMSFGEPITAPVASADHLTAHRIADNDAERELMKQIEENTVQLAFQQLYDKEDIDTHLYEVTSSFNHGDQYIILENFPALRSNPELAIKLDRWVLVEASKRLHQFLAKCPKARIIINLHTASLNDSTLVTLLTKLVNLINSKYTRPLILQFQEEDILTNMDTACRFIQTIQDYGVGVTISDFGQSAYCINILQQITPSFAKLSVEFSQHLLSDDGMVELQEKLDHFKEHNPDVKFLISHLDDMTSFANAWNVDVRYLQGNYFQTKQTEFLDSAG